MNLESERLILRPIQLKDRTDVFAYRSDQETNRYQGWIPKTLEDVEAFIAKVSPTFNVPETWFQLVIIEKTSQQLIGDIGVHFVDQQNQQVEFGCTLNKQFQHKGYATESLQCLLDYLFLTLNKHRVTASIDPENNNIIKLLERLGFRKEAHFVESLFLNGEWVDDVIYALLKKEWPTPSSAN